MPADLRQTLNDLALFSSLTKPERDEMHSRLTTHTYQAGATIYRAGDESNDAYIVLDGAVRIVAGNDHAPVEVAEAGMLFGYASVLTHARRATTAVAEKRTRLIRVPAADVDMLVERISSAHIRSAHSDAGRMAADA